MVLDSWLKVSWRIIGSGSRKAKQIRAARRPGRLYVDSITEEHVSQHLSPVLPSCCFLNVVAEEVVNLEFTLYSHDK